MGQFLNPDNQAFQDEVNSQIYVDKTGLIAYSNSVCGTSQKYICSSRPRRFGKSYTADMLTAYYSKGCNSTAIFADYAVSRTENYDKYLNACNVIHLDIQWFLTAVGSPDKVVGSITESVITELRQTFADVDLDNMPSLSFALARVHAQTGARFIVIIDEWDVLIRDAGQYPQIQEEYINFLRGLFKGSEPSKYILLAYLTGILPIKRLKTQSALNDFDEFTMLYPGVLAPYIGFTAEEVRKLCLQYHRDYEKVRQWYDGYLLGGYQVYNPRAVIGIMLTGEYRSYWSSTGTYESIVPFINIDFDGLKTSIMEMLAGAEVTVNTGTFQNDLVSFRDRDDVLTLLIHMGYLAFRQETQTAYIPNEEIRMELLNAVRASRWTAFQEFQRQSQRLLEAVLNQEEAAVAAYIGEVHDAYASSIRYNDENSLSSVLTIAFLATLQYYFKPIREMPAGRGFADFVYIPKPEFRKDYPALVVELKWDKTAETALDQIREKKYPASVSDYTGNILLAGINYDKKTKEHRCRIEKFTA